jgi:anti-sigma factor RsiW
MWHVDEGGLHAYLDDALDALPEGERIREHLAACDACQRRLAEERDLRAEARAILALASPDLGDLPSLEELEKRAGTHGSGGTSSRGRWWRLGWAASVVAAGAVGWVFGGRSVSPAEIAGTPEVAGPEIRALAPQVSTVEPTPGPEGVKTQGLQAEAASAKTGEPRPEVPRAATTTVESVDRAPVDAPATVAETARQEDEAVVPQVGARPSDLLVAPRFEPLFPPTSLGLMARGSAPSADSLALVVTSRRGAVDFGTLVPLERAQRVRVGSVQLAGSRLLPTSGGVAPASDAVVRQAELPTFAFTAHGHAKVATGVGQDSEPPGSLMVPGLEVVGVSWLQPGGAGGGVRVLQRLESGDTLELIRLPAGSSLPQEGSSRSDGRTQIAQARNGGWLIARARLPRAALASLVGRLGGG